MCGCGTKAAFAALLDGKFPNPVPLLLPKGECPSFALAREGRGEGWAQAGSSRMRARPGRDARLYGDCHGAAGGQGITFKAGEGVGTVTRRAFPSHRRSGDQSVPRAMMRQVIEELGGGDVEIEISFPAAARWAQKTWNPRLGLSAGFSILGTTGIVHPFSCAAWIASSIAASMWPAPWGLRTSRAAPDPLRKMRCGPIQAAARGDDGHGRFCWRTSEISA